MRKISGLYLQGGEGEEEGGTGFRGRKINISLEFIVLISEMIAQLAVCSTK